MLAKLRAAKSEESGFTLVELLVVIAILGILAGVVVFSVAGITDNSQAAACKAEATTVKAAEEANYVKAKIYVTGPGLKAARLLNDDPTLVAVTLTGTPIGSSYTLAYTLASGCTGTP